MIRTILVYLLTMGLVHAYDAPNKGIKPARILTQQDMERPPVSAAAFVQCNLLIAVYATLQNGDFVKADVAHHPKVPINDIMAWGDKAVAGAERVEAACDDPSKEMQT